MTDHTSSLVPCSFEGLREFVWVGGCVTARAAWASPPRRRRRRSVHRSAKMVSRSRFGAFVYTVATRGSRERPGTQECTQIGENGPSGPFWGICVHCCGASCVGWHERPNRHGVPAAAPRWPASPLAGKTGSARVAPPPGWRFSLGCQPTQTPEEPLKGKVSSHTPAKAIHAHVTHHAPQLALGLSGTCVHGLPHLAHHLVHLAPLLDDLIDLLNTMA